MADMLNIWILDIIIFVFVIISGYLFYFKIIKAEVNINEIIKEVVVVFLFIVIFLDVIFVLAKYTSYQKALFNYFTLREVKQNIELENKYFSNPDVLSKLPPRIVPTRTNDNKLVLTDIGDDEKLGTPDDIHLAIIEEEKWKELNKL